MFINIIITYYLLLLFIIVRILILLINELLELSYYLIRFLSFFISVPWVITIGPQLHLFELAQIGPFSFRLSVTQVNILVVSSVTQTHQ